MQDLFSLLSIAKKLNIPESTLRYYTRKFNEYLPSVGDGRQKRYRPEAVEILQIIADMFKENRSVTDIANYLSLKYPRNIESVDTSSLPSLTHYSLNDLPAIFKDFLTLHAEIIKQSLAKDRAILEQQDTIKQKDIEISETRETLTNINKELRKSIEYKADLQAKNKELAAVKSALDTNSSELDQAKATITKARDELQRLFDAQKDANAKGRALIEKEAALEARERELETLREENERLKRPWWKRIFHREKS